MSKLLLLAVVLLAAYLNRTYAMLFDFPGEKALQSPYKQVNITLDNPNATGSAKYVSLGDSLTAGVGSYDSQQTLPYLIAQNLNSKHGRLTLINLAKPGATTQEVLRYQLPQAIAEKPDYVTLLIGINDLRSYGSLENFSSDYYQIARQLKDNTSSTVYLLNLPYLSGLPITYPPWNFLLDLRTRQYNDIILAVSTALELPLIDLYSGSKSEFETDPRFYSADLFHPSAKGYILWANLINAH